MALPPDGAEDAAPAVHVDALGLDALAALGLGQPVPARDHLPAMRDVLVGHVLRRDVAAADGTAASHALRVQAEHARELLRLPLLRRGGGGHEEGVLLERLGDGLLLLGRDALAREAGDGDRVGGEALLQQGHAVRDAGAALRGRLARERGLAAEHHGLGRLDRLLLLLLFGGFGVVLRQLVPRPAVDLDTSLKAKLVAVGSVLRAGIDGKAAGAHWQLLVGLANQFRIEAGQPVLLCLEHRVGMHSVLEIGHHFLHEIVALKSSTGRRSSNRLGLRLLPRPAVNAHSELVQLSLFNGRGGQ
mmetsp:Transcript_3217/g.9039  ORF Transcript_3217/g.9039 Transcript_3217/m.9039 type:complete len:302 (+) Transcript_3217:540-1445(+)